MRRLSPDGAAAAVDDDTFRGAYEYPATRPWVRASMVATLDGVIRGADGDSRSIASAADRRVFSLLRLRADVVLVGAGTLRTIDYPPSRLPIAVVSNSMHLPRSLRVFAESGPATPRPIVYTNAIAAQRVAELADIADVVVTGDNDVDLVRVIRDLDERGLGRIHCEGGPRLLSALVAADLVDELLVTVTPRLRGGSDHDHILTIARGIDRRLTFTSVFEEDGSVFLRATRTPRN